MQFMLNTLHLQNGGSSDSDDCTCIVHQTFHGKLSSTVTCDSCRNTTTALDPYMDLSLDVRNLPKKRKLEAAAAGEVQMDLRDCLDRFTGREKLGSAEYTCRNCDGGQNAVKQLSIKRLPPTLSIHLKVSSSPSNLCASKAYSPGAAFRALKIHLLQNRNQSILPPHHRPVPLHHRIPLLARQRLKSILIRTSALKPQYQHARQFPHLRALRRHRPQRQDRLGTLRQLFARRERLVCL